MNIRILGDTDTPAYRVAAELIERLGHTVCGENGRVCLAVAPLLTRILADEEIGQPAFGTLIFHPSPLPYGRGASAIKWAYKRCEPITATTWFWADNGIDAGDICEQEIIRIDRDMRPRDFYREEMIPAMLRTLERALAGLSKGIIRRIPQVERYATYDSRI